MAARPFEGKESIPLELLFLLVEHNGEIVSREQIVSRIWGDGVFLDTDNSIRGAVRKLRQVLKDNVESPRFIQTVTGQGYRFIAPVAEASVVEAPLVEAPVVESPAAVSGFRWTLGRLALIGITLIAVYVTRRPSEPAAASGKTVLAILPFENLSRDPEQDFFSDGLTEEMIAQTGKLNRARLAVVARSSV